MKSSFLKTLPIAVALTLGAVSAQADTIAQWTFEINIPATAGTFAPEVGSGSALGYHANGATVYSNPVGNGSAESFSSNTWSVGDYYQFSVSTLGMDSISLSWDQISSSTGPRDFKLAYSVNGTAFTDFANYSVLVNSTPNTWTSATYNAASTFSYNLSAITALNNQASVYFRLIDASTTSANGGTVATAGTDRVDNFTVSGSTTQITAVPEPETYALFLAGLGLLGFAARRRNT